ncbi:MAG TPA: hypothetical protein VE398_17680 [Acidobacteriota bacterium]|nr:hypothetical protein [Acidobacteriota bacterium]
MPNSKCRILTLIALPVPFIACLAISLERQQPDAWQSVSLLEKSTLFTVYGRAFNTAPILGRLGGYKDINEMAEDVKPWIDGIKQLNDNRGVVVGIHLIYAMAIPCKPKDDCLMYLEGRDKHIVENYIQPAA